LHLLPSEYQKIANQDGKQTILNDNNYNKEFIKLLKERNLITKDKSEKSKKIRLYIKNKDI
jgi:DNA-dependent RNA polymerase auxiliary subunit epsilon